jgi:hypothetical protein
MPDELIIDVVRKTHTAIITFLKLQLPSGMSLAKTGSEFPWSLEGKLKRKDGFCAGRSR